MKERKYVRHKPLKVNMEHTWCKILKEIVEHDCRFSKYFTMNEKEFDFKETISKEVKLEARKTAFELYNPKMRS